MAKTRERATRRSRSAPKRPATRRSTTPVPTSTISASQLPASRRDVPRVRAGGPPSSGSGIRAANIATVSIIGPAKTRMIIMPRRGLRAESTGLEAHTVNALFALRNAMGGPAVKLSTIVGNLPFATSPLLSSGVALTVIDSIAENGAKLVEMNPADEAILRASLPGLRLVPEVFYEPLSLRLSLESSLQASGSGSTVRVTITSAAGGQPLRDLRVIAFTDFAQRIGAEAFADAKGVAVLTFASKPATIERLYVFAERGFWSMMRRSVSTATP